MVRVVILTTFGLDEYLFDALRYGASGFLLKDTRPGELVEAVRVVAAGDSLISPSMTRRLIEEFATRAKPARPAKALDVLTEREREVLALVAGGLTNDEIGHRLYLSPATARTHVSRIMTKLAAPRPHPARRTRLRNRPRAPRMAPVNLAHTERDATEPGTTPCATTREESPKIGVQAQRLAVSRPRRPVTGRCPAPG
jgi:DNA-binding NarL/FixJ family response regulator